jgi:hypothetical protein
MARYGTYNSPGGFKLTIYGIVIVALFLAMFYFTRNMYRENPTGRPGAAARAQERLSARNELRDKTATALRNGGVIDTNKGLVRIPISRAMEMTIKAYENPDAARSNLVDRSQKAAAPAPQPSFE